MDRVWESDCVLVKDSSLDAEMVTVLLEIRGRHHLRIPFQSKSERLKVHSLLIHAILN